MQALQYVESQPWPFPQSLMISFTAEVEAQQRSEAHVREGLGAEARQAYSESGLLADELEEYAFNSIISEASDLVAVSRG